MKYLITNKGLELQAKIQSGTGGNLKLTKAKAAAGYSLNPTELLDLIDIRQDMQIEDVLAEGNKAIIELILSNIGLENDYILMQIGIYAADPDTDEEILYLIGQDVRGERVPPIAELEIEYKFRIAMTISNASTIIFDTSANDFLNKKTFNVFINEQFNPHVKNKENPHEVTYEQTGAAAADHIHDISSGLGIDGILPLKNGGTGAANAVKALANLGAAPAIHSHTATDIEGGIIPVVNGGTGASAADGARINLGLGNASTQNVANNCTTTAVGYLLDARQGKALQDRINQVNSNFRDGCSIIAGKITACGVATASNAAPQTMANNIQAIFDNRWNGGYNAGWNAGVGHVSTNNGTVSMISIGSASNHGGSWTVSDVNLVIILIETPGQTAYSTSVTNATQIYTWQHGDNAYVGWRTAARYQTHTVSAWIDRSSATAVVMCVRY